MDKIDYKWIGDEYTITVGDNGEYAPEDIVKDLEKLKQENELLRIVYLASHAALECVYGGDFLSGDVAPIDTLTPDRVAIFDKLLLASGAVVDYDEITADFLAERESV